MKAAIILLILISGCYDLQQIEKNDLPHESEILFVSNRDTGYRRSEIYSMTATGDQQTRITFSDKHFFILGIHDRRWVVASCADEDTDEPIGLGAEDRRNLWVIDLQSGSEYRITDPDYHAEGKSFSPDGEWIVFMMKKDRGDPSDIYKIRRDGTDLVNLTNTDEIIECDPEWSSDGRSIVFTSLDPHEDTPHFKIKTMSPDGSDIRLVYSNAGGPSVPGAWPPGSYDPSWSPDGQWIAFEQLVQYTQSEPENFGNGVWNLFTINIHGGGPVNLSQNGGHTNQAEYLPSYSSTGNLILFGSVYQALDPTESFNDVFIMDSNGNNVTRLTTDSSSNMYPVWID